MAELEAELLALLTEEERRDAAKARAALGRAEDAVRGRPRWALRSPARAKTVLRLLCSLAEARREADTATATGLRVMKERDTAIADLERCMEALVFFISDHEKRACCLFCGSSDERHRAACPMKNYLRLLADLQHYKEEK